MHTTYGARMAEKSWRNLCEAIMQETDAHKLLELVDELNQALAEREKELKRDESADDQ